VITFSRTLIAVSDDVTGKDEDRNKETRETMNTIATENK